MNSKNNNNNSLLLRNMAPMPRLKYQKLNDDNLNITKNELIDFNNTTQNSSIKKIVIPSFKI